MLKLSALSVVALGYTPPGRARQPVKLEAGYIADIPQGAPDAILGIAQAFRESSAENKVNLAVGAYRDDGGVPFVLPSVSEAERRILERGEKKEYAPIDGLADYTKLALQFAYGDCAPLKEGRIAGVQTLSGTGACRIAGEFYARFLPEGTAIYASDPTWGNHIPIMKLAGLEVKRYKYLDRATNTLDFDGFMSDLDAAPSGATPHAVWEWQTGSPQKAKDSFRIQRHAAMSRALADYRDHRGRGWEEVLVRCLARVRGTRLSTSSSLEPRRRMPHQEAHPPKGGRRTLTALAK